MVLLLPPAPPALVLPLPPPAPSTSTWAEVTPAGGVHVPEPFVQVTVTVVVPDSLQVPVAWADAAWGTAMAAARLKPHTRLTTAPITARRRTPKRLLALGWCPGL